MHIIQRVWEGFDRFQRHHSVIGFPVAVLVKFGKDQIGNQVALMAYYAFLSLFPLLLVCFTLVPYITGHNYTMEQHIVNAVLKYFPGFGSQLAHNIHSFRRSGIALAIALLFTFYGARGIASILQTITNTIWGIPPSKQPGFPRHTIQSLSIVAIGGVGFILSTLIVGFVTSIMQGNILGKALLLLVSLTLSSGLLLLILRIATAQLITLKQLIVPSICTTIAWHLVQAYGSFLVLHQLKTASVLYGTFAIVLGLLTWLYIQVAMYVYILEITVVKSHKLWPVALTNSKDR